MDITIFDMVSLPKFVKTNEMLEATADDSTPPAGTMPRSAENCDKGICILQASYLEKEKSLKIMFFKIVLQLEYTS